MPTWPRDDLPAPGRFSLARVLAARKGHARRRAKAEQPRPMVQMQGRDAWPARASTPEMAVYDPTADDTRRERMSARDSWVLLALYVGSASFVAWLLSVLAAYFKALPR